MTDQITTYTVPMVTATRSSATLATTRPAIEHSTAAHAPFRARAVLSSRVRASSSESDTSTEADNVIGRSVRPAEAPGAGLAEP